MKLNLPDFLQAVQKRRVPVLDEGEIPFGVPSMERPLKQMAARIDSPDCQKYIFDSGEDAYNDTNAAVRSTATAMMQMGQFHLPHPEVWIEDPYPEDRCRLYIHAVEKNGFIRVTPIFEVPSRGRSERDTGLPANYAELAAKETGKDPRIFQAFVEAVDSSDLDDPALEETRRKNRFILYGVTGVLPIDGSEHSDLGWLEWMSQPGKRAGMDLIRANAAGSALYTVKKLIVALFAVGTEREKSDPVPKSAARASLPFKSRKYPFTVIRVPSDTGMELRRGSGGGGRLGVKLRKQLVAGYVWGRHTRPEDQQRLIAPYWRGSEDPETPVEARTHYEVR